jgi:quercetin dioxygenase-like cupin family protein
MSTEQGYPDLITKLPRIQSPAKGVRGWLLQAPDQQLVFFDIEAIGTIPPHSHGAQWGIVVEGEMDLTIDGETRRVRPGDSYFIPAGAVHSATFLSHCRAIDMFADRDRYEVAGD